MKRKAVFVALIAFIFILPIIVMNYNKYKLKKEYEEMANASIQRAVDIIEDYKENKNSEELINLACELSVFYVCMDKLEEQDGSMKNCTQVARARSILISKQEQIDGFEYLYEGLLNIKDDIYNDVWYDYYLNSFVNENIGG